MSASRRSQGTRGLDEEDGITLADYFGTVTCAPDVAHVKSLVCEEQPLSSIGIWCPKLDGKLPDGWKSVNTDLNSGGFGSTRYVCYTRWQPPVRARSVLSLHTVASTALLLHSSRPGQHSAGDQLGTAGAALGGGEDAVGADSGKPGYATPTPSPARPPAAPAAVHGNAPSVPPPVSSGAVQAGAGGGAGAGSGVAATDAGTSGTGAAAAGSDSSDEIVEFNSPGLSAGASMDGATQAPPSPPVAQLASEAQLPLVDVTVVAAAGKEVKAPEGYTLVAQTVGGHDANVGCRGGAKMYVVLARMWLEGY